MSKLIPRMWDGETVWILGSGYSLMEQFGVPHEIHQQIASGEADIHVLSLYLADKLLDKRVMGANLSGLIGAWVDVLYFRDCDFYWNNYARIRWGFQGGLRFSSCRKKPLGSEVWILDKGDSMHGISTGPNQVCWNYDSGGAAINLAVQLGAKRIILVGYDMRPGPNGEKRWHGEHNKPDGRETRQPYDRFLKAYGQIAEDAGRLGVEIINANPWSALDQFPKADVESLL